MIGILKKLYHKYSNTKLFQTLGNIYRNGFFVSNFMSYLRMKKLASKTYQNNEKIRVVFLCQYVQAWNKLKPVYERMRTDERYEAMIVAVPYDIKKVDMEVFHYFKGIYGAKSS